MCEGRRCMGSILWMVTILIQLTLAQTTESTIVSTPTIIPTPELVLNLRTNGNAIDLQRMNVLKAPAITDSNPDAMVVSVPIDVCGTVCVACAANSTEQRKLLPSTVPANWTGDEEWNVANILQCVTIWGIEPCTVWTSTVGLTFNVDNPIPTPGASLVTVQFPSWCSCATCPNSPWPVDTPPVLYIEKLELRMPSGLLVLRASQQLSLPSISPVDLGALFMPETVSTFGTNPQALWVGEQELRVNLSSDSTMMAAAAASSVSKAAANRNLLEQLPSLQVQLRQSGWRMRGYPSVLAILSPEVAQSGIVIIRPPPPSTGGSTGTTSSSTGRECAAGDSQCIQGEDKNQSGKSFLDSTENKMGLGIGLGAGVILLGTVVACVIWGKRSSKLRKGKGATAPPTPSTPASGKLLPHFGTPPGSPGSLPSLSSISHPKTPPTPKSKKGKLTVPSPGSGGPSGIAVPASPDEVVLHMITEEDEMEASRSMRPGSRAGGSKHSAANSRRPSLQPEHSAVNSRRPSLQPAGPSHGRANSNVLAAAAAAPGLLQSHTPDPLEIVTTSMDPDEEHVLSPRTPDQTGDDGQPLLSSSAAAGSYPSPLALGRSIAVKITPAEEVDLLPSLAEVARPEKDAPRAEPTDQQQRVDSSTSESDQDQLPPRLATLGADQESTDSATESSSAAAAADENRGGAQTPKSSKSGPSETNHQLAGTTASEASAEHQPESSESSSNSSSNNNEDAPLQPHHPNTNVESPATIVADLAPESSAITTEATIAADPATITSTQESSPAAIDEPVSGEGVVSSDSASVPSIAPTPSPTTAETLSGSGSSPPSSSPLSTASSARLPPNDLAPLVLTNSNSLSNTSSNSAGIVPLNSPSGTIDALPSPSDLIPQSASSDGSFDAPPVFHQAKSLSALSSLPSPSIYGPGGSPDLEPSTPVSPSGRPALGRPASVSSAGKIPSTGKKPPVRIHQAARPPSASVGSMDSPRMAPITPRTPGSAALAGGSTASVESPRAVPLLASAPASQRAAGTLSNSAPRHITLSGRGTPGRSGIAAGSSVPQSPRTPAQEVASPLAPGSAGLSGNVAKVNKYIN